MSEWQPIESAPKDGTVILGYRDIKAGVGMWVVVWWREGAWQFTRRAKDALDQRLAPTHWMHLPEPPVSP